MDIASRWRIDLNAKNRPLRRVNNKMGLRVVTAGKERGDEKSEAVENRFQGYISGVMPPKARLATLYILVIFYYRSWQHITHIQVRGKDDFSTHRVPFFTVRRMKLADILLYYFVYKLFIDL